MSKSHMPKSNEVLDLACRTLTLLSQPPASRRKPCQIAEVVPSRWIPCSSRSPTCMAVMGRMVSSRLCQKPEVNVAWQDGVANTVQEQQRPEATRNLRVGREHSVD